MNNLLKGKVFISIQKMNGVWFIVSFSDGITITIEGGFEFNLKDNDKLTSEQYVSSNYSIENLELVANALLDSCIIAVQPDWESGKLSIVFSNNSSLVMFPEDDLLDAWAIRKKNELIYEVSGNRGI